MPRVLLVEALDRVLPTYPEELSGSARRQLERLGVTVRTSTRVTAIDESGIERGRSGRRIGADRADPDPHGPVGGRRPGVELRPQGRRGARRRDGSGGPGAGRARPDGSRSPRGDDRRRPGGRDAQGRQARAWASRPRRSRRASTRPRSIRRRVRGETARPFRYRDRGDVAVIGRLSGVADIRWLGRFGRMSGFLAWGMWLGRPHRLSDRLRQPARGHHPLGLELPDARPRDPTDHRRAAPAADQTARTTRLIG